MPSRSQNEPLLPRLRGFAEPCIVGVLTLLLHVYLRAGLGPGTFEKYVLAARRLAEGALAPERLIDFSPLYLLVHRVALALFDRPGVMLAWTQTVAVALAAVLLALVLEREVPSRLVRFAALAAFVFSPSLLVYTSVLEPEALLVASTALLLWSFPAGTAASPTAGASPSRWLAAGLVVAPLLLLRPTMLSALVFGSLAAFLSPHPAHHRPSLRERLAPAWRFAAPGVAVLLLLAVRNAALIGELTPQIMNPGTVFYEGNNPLSWGASATYPPAVYAVDAALYADEPDHPHVLYRELARASAGDGESMLSVGEVNRYWRNKALAHLGSHPREAVRLGVAKLWSILQNRPDDDVAVAAVWREELGAEPVPLFPWCVLVVSALWGAWVCRRAWRERLLLYGLLVTQVGAMLLFYVSARQRLSLLPVLVVFAALGWRALLDSTERSRRPPVAVGLVLLSIALLPAAEPLRDRRHRMLARESAGPLVQQAGVQRDASALGRAAELAAQALARAPTELDRIRPFDLAFPNGYAATALAESAASAPPVRADLEDGPPRRFDEAWLTQMAGDTETARQLWTALRDDGFRFARGGERSSQPEYYLAVLDLEAGERDSARQRVDRLLARRPGEAFVLALAAVLDPQGDHETKLDRYYDAVSRDLLLGEAQCRWGDRLRGRQRLKVVVEKMPRLRQAWIELAFCYDEATRTESREAYRHAMSLLAEPVPRESRAMPLFAESPAQDPDGRLFHARVLRQYGRYGEALGVLQAMEPVPPELRGAHRESVTWLLERLREGVPDASATTWRP